MEVKIFISSTFKDMGLERDAIRQQVLPTIQEYALKYGVNVNIVDLRWGINTLECDDSSSSSIKILKTCFDEIESCKPFFIGIIGKRYGWIPSLENVISSIDEKYKNKIELTEKSVTECEMEYALSSLASNSSYIFCFRDEFKAYINKEDEKIYGSDDNLDRIERLKNKIKSKNVPYFNYEVELKDNRYNLDIFVELLISYLKKALDERFKDAYIPKNYIEKEIILQKTLINQKDEYFKGRSKILSTLKNSQGLMILGGVSGIGKSSLMSHLINDSLDDGLTLSYLCGVSENSLYVNQMLVSFIYQLSQYLDLKFNNDYFSLDYILNHDQEILSSFYLLLEKASLKTKITIIVDALDQFKVNEEKERLNWINTYYLNSLNNKVKIVLSSIINPEMMQDITIKDIKLIELNEIDEEDIILIAKHVLSKNNKELSDDILSVLLEKKENGALITGNPLYLNMLLQEIILFDNYDFNKIHLLEKEMSSEKAIYHYIKSIIDSAPNKLNLQFFRLVKRSVRLINEEFIYHVLGIISLSKNGVREEDIKYIFDELNIHYEASSYYYFKKIFKSFLKEYDGYINYSHQIIDKILENYFLKEHCDLGLKINKATISYLKKLNDDSFKKENYLYYLYLVKDNKEYLSYLYNNVMDEKVINSFIDNYQYFYQGNVDYFYQNIYQEDETKIINIILKNKSPHYKECMLLDMLFFNHNLLSNILLQIYVELCEIFLKYDNASTIEGYLKITQKMFNKAIKKSKIDKELFLRFISVYHEYNMVNNHLFTMKRYYSSLKRKLKYSELDKNILEVKQKMKNNNENLSFIDENIIYKAYKDKKIDNVKLEIETKIKDINQELLKREDVSLLRLKIKYLKILDDINIICKKPNYEIEQEIDDILSKLIKITHQENDAYIYADNKYRLFKYDKVNKNEVKDAYQNYYQYGNYHIDSKTNVIKNLFLIVLISYLIIVYVFGVLFLSDNIYAFAYLIDRYVLTVIFSYLINTYEILIFMVSVFFMYAFMHNKETLNKYKMINKYYKKMGIIYLTLLIIIYIPYVYYWVIYLDYGLYPLFIFINSLCSSYLIFNIISKIKKGDIIDTIIDKKKVKKNYLINIIIVIMIMLLFIVITFNTNFVYWHSDVLSYSTAVLILILSVASLITTISSYIKLRRGLYENN